MVAKIIDGKSVAEEIKSELKKDIEALKGNGIVPSLHIILIGENPSSNIYVKVKEKACREIGIDFELEKLPEGVKEDDVIERVKKLNLDKKVNGIIVQLPLPNNITTDKIIDSIDPAKDIDGLTPYNLGRLVSGDETISAATPKGIIKLLEKSGIYLEGKRVAVINRSLNVGRPLIHLLLNRGATVSVCHSKTRDISEITRNSDIIVCAVGKPKFLKADMIKEGATVIDVGLTYVNGKGLGDVDFDSLKEKASFITPVPGGVGPMTVISLLENTVKAARLQNGL